MRPVSVARFAVTFVFAVVAGSWGMGQEDAKAPKSAGVNLTPLIEAHNRVRAAEKRSALRANSQLSEAAQDHARDMAQHNNLSHEGSDGSDVAKRVKRRHYSYQAVGENIADGQRTIEEAMRSWLDSPPHRKNILGDFSEIGVAVSPDDSGRKYWCVVLGRPLPKVDLKTGPAAMLAALNRTRTDAKQTTVKADAKLAQVADRFAKDLAARRVLETKDRDGQSPFDMLKRQKYAAQRFGLSLASGESDPAKVVASWIEDKEERESVLARYNRAGVGVAHDQDGNPYWVVIQAQAPPR